MGDADLLQADFAYGAGAAGATASVSLAIYADRAHLRASLRDDAQGAGVTVVASAGLSDLVAGDAAAADVVLVDCPQLDAATFAALARLDLRASRSRTRLIISTGVDALDGVFACMDQSAPQLLVDPDRGERLVALGRAMAGLSSGRVRELSDDDRLMLLRLTEQVGRIAGRIDRLDPTGTPASVAEAPAPATAPVATDFPDARLVRRIIRQRQLRARFMDAELFADPAWDMLLDLTAARLEGKRVSVSSLCIAAAVPPTTALRWIGQMVEQGLFLRVSDETDRRRVFIALSDVAAEAMSRYFAEIASSMAVPV